VAALDMGMGSLPQKMKLWVKDGENYKPKMVKIDSAKMISIVRESFLYIDKYIGRMKDKNNWTDFDNLFDISMRILLCDLKRIDSDQLYLSIQSGIIKDANTKQSEASETVNENSDNSTVKFGKICGNYWLVTAAEEQEMEEAGVVAPTNTITKVKINPDGTLTVGVARWLNGGQEDETKTHVLLAECFNEVIQRAFFSLQRPVKGNLLAGGTRQFGNIFSHISCHDGCQSCTTLANILTQISVLVDAQIYNDNDVNIVGLVDGFMSDGSFVKEFYNLIGCVRDQSKYYHMYKPK
jgi:hypothetical protein